MAMARFSLEVWISSRSSPSNVRGRFLRFLLRFRNRKINKVMKSVSNMVMSVGAGGDSGML